MNTITIPQTKFNLLEKRATLYEKFLRSLPERRWGIEDYSGKRVREFMREDRLNPKLRSQLKKLID